MLRKVFALPGALLAKEVVDVMPDVFIGDSVV
jgi:hypothetical protein